MEIVNLSPHTLTVLKKDENGPVIGTVGYGSAQRQIRCRVVTEIAPDPQGPARARTFLSPNGEVEINGEKIPVNKVSYGEVELPPPQEGVYLFVSKIAAEAAKAQGRAVDDLLIPGETVRDGEGKVIGILNFSRL